MCSLSSWLRLCYVLKLVEGLNSYVLLAANVDDFRNIARKIVPEPLADKLARLASKMPVKQNIRVNDQSDYDYESETDEDFDRKKKEGVINYAGNINTASVESKSVYVKEWDTRINFDELVKRVKDRLAKEINEEFQKKVPRPDKVSQIHNNDGNRELSNAADRPTAIADNNSKSDDVYDQDGFRNENVYSNNPNRNKQNPIRGEKNERNTNDYAKTDELMNEWKKIYVSNKKTEKTAYQAKENQYYYKDPENTREQVKSDREIENSKPNNNYFNNNWYVNEEKHSDEMSYDWNSNKNVRNTKNTDKQYFTEKEAKNRDFETTHHQGKDASEKHIQVNDDRPQKNINNHPLAQKLSNKNKPRPPVTLNTELFNQYELTSNRKNDSYEDYSLPNKENIFASDETTKHINNRDRYQTQKLSDYNHNKNSRFKVKNNSRLENVKSFTDEWKKDDYVNMKLYDGGKVKDKSQEVKAKTESLWFNEDRLKESVGISEVPTRKHKSKGTMIPTREVYKMVSPNYYISLPTVAERFDPNEPLPERDRHRETIKHFVNPPASINKKVKLI